MYRIVNIGWTKSTLETWAKPCYVRGTGTRNEPLRRSAWEASGVQAFQQDNGNLIKQQ